MATRVNAGDLRRVRKAYFKSFITTSDDRIDLHRATRGKHAGENCSQSENRDGNGEEKGAVSRGLIKLRGNQTAQRQDCNQSRDQSEDDRPHSLIENEPQNIVRLRTKRHSDTDFVRALGNAVGNGTVNSDAG